MVRRPPLKPPLSWLTRTFSPLSSTIWQNAPAFGSLTNRPTLPTGHLPVRIRTVNCDEAPESEDQRQRDQQHGRAQDDPFPALRDPHVDAPSGRWMTAAAAVEGRDASPGRAEKEASGLRGRRRPGNPGRRAAHGGERRRRHQRERPLEGPSGGQRSSGTPRRGRAGAAAGHAARAVRSRGTTRMDPPVEAHRPRHQGVGEVEGHVEQAGESASPAASRTILAPARHRRG